MSLDVLVIGPHPDDAELGAGGTLALLARRGLRTGILDLTQGELATRGTPAQRAEEAAAAAKLLGLAERMQAGLPDGNLADTPEQRATVVRCLRTLRPRILIVPQAPDRHPDHVAAHHLAHAANFLAGLARVEDALPPHRATIVLGYHPYAAQETQPAFVQDISEAFALKMEALRAYRSQFHDPTTAQAETYVSSSAFWEGIATRAAYWGLRIGVPYGEPFYAAAPMPLDISKAWP